MIRLDCASVLTSASSNRRNFYCGVAAAENMRPQIQEAASPLEHCYGRGRHVLLLIHK
jgi:hypothetical protein